MQICMYGRYASCVLVFPCCQIALKCADVCNPCRDWELSRQWSERVCEEFYRQGEKTSTSQFSQSFNEIY